MTLVSSVILSVGVAFLYFTLRRLETTVRLVEKSSKVQICDEDVNAIVDSAIGKLPKPEPKDDTKSEKKIKEIEENVNRYMSNVHSRIEYEISQLNAYKKQHEQFSVNDEKPEAEESKAVVADEKTQEPSVPEEVPEEPKPKAKTTKRTSKRSRKTASTATTRVTRSRKKKEEEKEKENCIIIPDIEVEQ